MTNSRFLYYAGLYLFCVCGLMSGFALGALVASFAIWDISPFLIFLELFFPFARLSALVAVIPTIVAYLDMKGKSND